MALKIIKNHIPNLQKIYSGINESVNISKLLKI